jgi:cell shape-determining protein MreC
MRTKMTSHRVLIGLAVVLGLNSQLNTRHLHWVGAVPRGIVKTLANPPASLLNSAMVGLRGEDPGPDVIPPDATEQKLNELLASASHENRRLWEENRHLRDQLAGFTAAANVRGSMTLNLLPARVADYNPSRSNPTIELDKGSRAGVETDNPVIVSANLVGFIQGDVGTLRSSARLITAPDTRYAVRLIRPGSSTDDFGDATYIYTDDSGTFFHCDMPDGTHDIAVGDLASLADDRYPQALGYILGVVSEVRLDHPENPLELDRIIIRPAVDPSRLRNVSIQVKE